VQNLVPRSRVGIFRYERIRSTPLDPKRIFWWVSYYLDAFRIVWLPYETRCKMGRTSAKVRARSRVEFFWNEHTRSTPLDPKLIFWCVSYYLVHLGPFGCLTKHGAKRAELVQKFVPRSHVEIFLNECSNPPHWTLNWSFGSFQTIWVHSGPFGCLTKLGAKWAELVQ